MKKKRSLCLDDSDEIIRSPAYPLPGYKLLRELRSGLKLDGKKDQPTLPRLAQYLGVATSTSHHWFSVGAISEIQAMLCVMERLGEFHWITIFEKFLRELPTLSHSRFAHDKEGVAKLQELLKERSGVTLICGGTDSDRTFVLTALGHTFSMSDPLRRRVTGLDRHEPRDFVPLENVVYFRNTISSPRLLELVVKHWTQLKHTTNALMVCNRILSRVPELADAIMAYAATNHVLVSDDESADYKRGLVDGIKVDRVVEIFSSTKATAEISFRVVQT